MANTEPHTVLNDLITNYNNHCKLIRSQCLINRDFSKPMDYSLLEKSELNLMDTLDCFIQINPSKHQLRTALRTLTEIPYISETILEHLLTKELANKDVKIIKKFINVHVEFSKSIFTIPLKKLASKAVVTTKPLE